MPAKPRKWSRYLSLLSILSFLVAGACFAPRIADLWGKAQPPAIAQSGEQPLFITRPIEQVRLGHRLLAHNPELTDAERDVPDPDPATSRALRLVMWASDGHRIDIELLRALDWIEEYEAEVGETIWLDLEELGAEGEAKVLAISPCPTIEPGEGRVVTGTFKHDSGDIIEVHIAGQPPIGCTANHPFWSEDRQAFVQAQDLRDGERLRTANQSLVRVLALRHRSGSEAVYNLEVDIEHVYYVGHAGVLVHNLYYYQGLHKGKGGWKGKKGRIVRAPTPRTSPKTGTPIPTPKTSPLPPKVLSDGKDAIGHIRGGTKPPWGGKWGDKHGNYEGNLPRTDASGNPITYKEYYLPKTAGDTTKGA